MRTFDAPAAPSPTGGSQTMPALEFVIVLDPADADGDTISLAALRARGRSQAELEERIAAVTPDAERLFLYKRLR